MLRGKVNSSDVGEKVAANNSNEPGGVEVSYANRLISSQTYKAEDVAW